MFEVIKREEKDILLHAGTGKGKTLAYLLPLANQIYEGDEGLKVALVQPNALLKNQIKGVMDKLLTPDHQRNFKICTPRQLREAKTENGFDVCVIDEADLSLSAACLPPKMKVHEFLRNETGGRRIIYSGATFPAENSFRSIRAQILKYNNKTEIIEDESITETRGRVSINSGNEHFIRFGKNDERVDKLREIIGDKGISGKIMVFVRSKVEVMEVFKSIKDLLERKEDVIVTTDSMSRGIDIDSLQHVIHYSPPMSAIDYVHRVGRLNRLNSKVADEDCRSYCLLSDEDISDGPLYLKLLIHARSDSLIPQNADISKFFGRNRSINKQIRRGKIQLP